MKRPKPHVALVMLGLNELGGGGGTERFFVDVFERFRRRSTSVVDVSLFIDRISYERFQDVGRLHDLDKVIVLSSTNWLGQAAEVRACLLAYQVTIIHVPLIAPQYLPFLYLLAVHGFRRHLTITAVSCDLAHRRGRLGLRGGNEEFKIRLLYWTYFNTLRLDGIYTWYRLLETHLREQTVRGDPVVASAPCFFVDAQRFRPAESKQRKIVFAARLSPQKRPMWLVDGVRMAIAMRPELFRGWRVEIYGRGVLENKLKRSIKASGLNGLMDMKNSGDLAEVFGQSSVFVSTQDYDNFSSLSMLEAMACGNAVVARDVGQTREFVRHRENGLLFAKDSPEGLAGALIEYLAEPALHYHYSVKSREIATKEQSAERFLGDLERFWLKVLGKSRDRES